uniref:Uncharacterized protein n=1 Tax=Caenorhabditis japonica TaxID=281687 RepID=A0A8R1EEY2_CAEJA
MVFSIKLSAKRGIGKCQSSRNLFFFSPALPVHQNGPFLWVNLLVPSFRFVFLAALLAHFRAVLISATLLRSPSH